MNQVLARPALQDVLKLLRMTQPGSPCWPHVNATACQSISLCTYLPASIFHSPASCHATSCTRCRSCLTTKLLRMNQPGSPSLRLLLVSPSPCAPTRLPCLHGTAMHGACMSLPLHVPVGNLTHVRDPPTNPPILSRRT